MLSALILPRRGYRLCLAGQPVHRRSVQHGPLVLVPVLLKSSTPTTDRDRTVSRRSEPSSRATLIGEQPNPWGLLQPGMLTSRHRGAKPLRRYELLGGISLLSRSTFLSFERRLFHAEPPDHYAQVSFLFDMYVSQSKRPYAIALCDRLPIGLRGTFRSLRYAFGGDHPDQTTRQAMSALKRVRSQMCEGCISTTAPLKLAPGFTASGLSSHRTPAPMLSCSKGSRGLFVPLRVIGIFTDTTISPSSRSRQCRIITPFVQVGTYPTREFRYLRDRYSYGRRLPGLHFTASIALTAPLNLPARAGVRLYTAPCGFAQPCVFAKQLPGIFSAPPLVEGGTYPEVTGSVCLVP